MLVDLEFNYEEAKKVTGIFRQEHIDELRNWSIKLDKSKCVPKNLCDKQILLFYNACSGDIEKTKSCIEMYYECRKNAPEMFNYRVWNADLRRITETMEMFYVPGTSFESYDIMFSHIVDLEPSNFDYEILCKLWLMILDLNLMKQGTRSGYIIVYDMRGIGMGHLARFNVLATRKLLQYLQEALPIRLKAIHILNTEPLVDKLISIFRPLINSEIFDIVHFHNKNESLDKFYDIVPKCSLPSNYGGSLSDSKTLHQQGLEELKLNANYFKVEEEQRLAALADVTGDSALDGTFRKLDFD